MDQHSKQSASISEGANTSQLEQSFQVRTPKIVRWIIEHSAGYIKNENQAQTVLLGFVVVSIIVATILMFNAGEKEAEVKAPPGQRVIYPKDAPPRLERLP